MSPSKTPPVVGPPWVSLDLKALKLRPALAMEKPPEGPLASQKERLLEGKTRGKRRKNRQTYVKTGWWFLIPFYNLHSLFGNDKTTCLF